ncbi:MAG: TetR/AcrR family transcriptional regulator [Anaerolineaceae bacterium]|nr:TetR/AcrR family transcriptional regulator [Anaerolineaceae bacterium]
MVNKRELILEIAMRLFTGYGYEATGVQEICEAAEVTKPTLYHYFKSKQGLLETLLQEKQVGFQDTLRQACEYKNDLTGNISSVMRRYFCFTKDEPVFYRLRLTLSYAPTKSGAYRAILPWLIEEHKLLAALFKAAAEDHGNMRERDETCALSLLGTINVYALEILNGRLMLDEGLIYRAQHQFMHGIFS